MAIGYFRKAFDPKWRDACIRYAREIVKKTGADTVAVRGCSGLAMGPIVAHALGLKLAIVRKPNEDSHCSYEVVGEVGRRYLIVDDFICYGGTVKEIMDKMQSGPGPIPREPVGILLYESAALGPEQTFFYTLDAGRSVDVPIFKLAAWMRGESPTSPPKPALNTSFTPALHANISNDVMEQMQKFAEAFARNAEEESKKRQAETRRCGCETCMPIQPSPTPKPRRRP